MRHLDEYRDPAAISAVIGRIGERLTRPWTLMEVCGGQTHAILRYGLDELLPERVRLIHGPGCPVCVTPVEQIDRALRLASLRGVTLCSFGDMLRVPGTAGDLLLAKARGGDVRVVYSPMDAVAIARSEPSRQVVFFAVGFETTAPANAAAVAQAAREGLDNFFLLAAHVLVPPVLEALLSSDDCQVQALLAPGHVCVITGYRDYVSISDRYRIPIVVTGFEPLDLLRGIEAAVAQLEDGRACVENRYERVAGLDGNAAALGVIGEVFQVCDRKWRGLGEIPASGLTLAPEYERFDAEHVFGLSDLRVDEPQDCPAGQILKGLLRPTSCPHFGMRCTPEHPLGATMVSSEGACAAYFHYGRTIIGRRGSARDSGVGAEEGR